MASTVPSATPRHRASASARERSGGFTFVGASNGAPRSAFAWGGNGGAKALRGAPFDATTKVNPPLRSRADALALWRGVADGTVDAIATDLAPHASVRKEVEYDQAAFGISGLETALPLLLAGIAAGLAPFARVIAALTSGPARVLGIALEPDDRVVIDPRIEWTVGAEDLVSKGKNTPLFGRTLVGRVVMVVSSGKVKLDETSRVAGTIARAG